MLCRIYEGCVDTVHKHNDAERGKKVPINPTLVNQVMRYFTCSSVNVCRILDGWYNSCTYMMCTKRQFITGGWVWLLSGPSIWGDKYTSRPGVLKSWVSRPTNKIVHTNPICPFWGSFPSLPPCPCLMLTPFQVFPPLLTPMVWEKQLPPPDIPFPLPWRWGESTTFVAYNAIVFV